MNAFLVSLNRSTRDPDRRSARSAILLARRRRIAAARRMATSNTPIDHSAIGFIDAKIRVFPWRGKRKSAPPNLR